MKHTDNYALQAEGAKRYFLTYDQDRLIEKLKLKADEQYLYTEMLCKPYRIRRSTGDLQRMEGTWVDARSHAEVMTLLDLVCDSRPDRHLAFWWKGIHDFSAVYHRGLIEEGRDEFARVIQDNQAGFRKACEALRGKRAPGGDLGYAVELFDGLPIAVQFWEGDEEFAPRVRFLWDENALMYLKYETMWFALGMLKQRILEEMKKTAEE